MADVSVDPLAERASISGGSIMPQLPRHRHGLALLAVPDRRRAPAMRIGESGQTVTEAAS